MDENKKELLRSVFLDMNSLDYHTETKEVKEITVEGDGEDFISAEQVVLRTLYLFSLPKSILIHSPFDGDFHNYTNNASLIKKNSYDLQVMKKIRE